MTVSVDLDFSLTFYICCFFYFFYSLLLRIMSYISYPPNAQCRQYKRKIDFLIILCQCIRGATFCERHVLKESLIFQMYRFLFFLIFVIGHILSLPFLQSSTLEKKRDRNKKGRGEVAKTRNKGVMTLNIYSIVFHVCQ